jgi:hypothetical protein
MIPWADALYACDFNWWERNRDIWQDFKGMKFTWSRQAATAFDILFAPGTKAKGLGRDKIHAGGSSGYMAVGLAYLLGAAEIYLLGFDMQMTGGKSHWHGDHKKTSNPSSDMLSKWVQCFDEIWLDLDALGIPLINCTRETALTIPRKPLEDVLNDPS